MKTHFIVDLSICIHIMSFLFVSVLGAHLRRFDPIITGPTQLLDALKAMNKPDEEQTS